MKYVAAYFYAFKWLFTVLGTVLFASNLLFSKSFLAEYLFFLVIVGSIAGPISIFLDKKGVT